VVIGCLNFSAEQTWFFIREISILRTTPKSCRPQQLPCSSIGGLCGWEAIHERHGPAEVRLPRLHASAHFFFASEKRCPEACSQIHFYGGW
jgi:hypothetical protein